MPDLPDLVPLDAAQRRVLDGVTPLPAEVVDLADAAGLVLAAPVRSALTVPSWINSAMDGFAVRGADIAAASPGTPVVLRVLGEVAGGPRPGGRGRAEGTALRIMTGAMMPRRGRHRRPGRGHRRARRRLRHPRDGGDLRRGPQRGDHIRHPGSDVKAGAHLLDRGRACDAAAIALLAATGHASVSVHRRPRVAVISTGDELVPPGLPLGPGQIHDSNSLTLAAQATEAGAEVRRLGIARDTLADLLALLREAVAWADVVVLSGGVSVGAHDHVKAAFDTLGDLALWRVAIKPGRPFAFARATVDGRSVRLFGLPGQPRQRVRDVRALRASRPAPARGPHAGVRPAHADRPPRRADAGLLGPAEHHPRRPRPGPGPPRRAAGPVIGRPGLLHAGVARGGERDDLHPAGRDLPAGAEVVAWELRDREG